MRKLLTILLLLAPLAIFAQTRQISGQILDSDTKEPLAGATVFIAPDEKGAANYNPQGVVADFDGNFTFTLPASVKNVVVSYLGFKAERTDVSKKTTFKIYLLPNVNELKDVVVTGYQKIEKRKVTSSISKVDLAEIQQAGVSSVDQLLQGQLSGVVTTPTNGGPGAPNKIRIRGTASLNGTQDPLWVVDGLPLEGNEVPTNANQKENIDNLNNMSIAGLNPEDIQDITILKDAAATAIYGARAANGVIVVTTKRGKKGAPKINFNAATFYTMKPDFDRLNLMNSTEKVDFELGLASRKDVDYRSGNGEVSRILNKYGQYTNFQNGGLDAISPEARAEINALRSKGDNWFDQIYRPTWNQQYGLSMSGGTDNINYYVSGGYFNEQGNTRGTGYERFNLSSNLDFKINKKLNFGVGLFATQSERSSYISDTDAFTNPSNYTRNVNPYLEAKDANGKYIYDKDIDGYSDRYVPFNYLEETENTEYKLNNSSVKSIFTLDYRVIRGLKLQTQLGLQLDHTGREKFADKKTYYTRKYKERTRYRDKDGTYKYFLPEGGVIQNWNEKYFQYNWKTQAEFARTFNDRHDFDAMAGIELRSNTTEEVHTKGFGFDKKTLATKPINFPDGNSFENNAMFRQYSKRWMENSFVSYYGTASYTFDNRYTVFGSIRFDGSNLFGVDPKYKYLPLWSLSGAWNINREEWLKDVNWLSNLKLRASYGLQGNIDRSTSPYIVGEWGNSSILPGPSEPGIGVTSPPNQNLRWEKTGTYNVGLDFGVLNNRLTMSLEAYYRDSRDLIGMRALPQENGFDFTSTNWARVTNKGFEISLSSVNITKKDFRWTTDFNFSHNKSNIEQINMRENTYVPERQAGYSVNAIFALPVAGMDKNGVPMFWKEGKRVTYKEFYDLKEGAWGILESGLSAKEYRDQFVYMGDADPKFSGGINNKFRYKDFDLAISASFNLDQTVMASPSYYAYKMDPGVNYTRAVADAWSPNNPNGTYPGFIGGNSPDTNWEYQWMSGMDPGNSYKNYDTWVKNISYLRINSIRFGYNVPEKVLKGRFISGARINLEARNPFVFGTNYDGYFDPETYGNIYAQPIPKSFSVGVNLSF